MLMPISLSRSIRPFAFAAAVALAGCSNSGTGVGPSAVAGMPPVGTVDMNEVQAAYLGSGSTGSGTLYFNGRSYSFKVGGLGVGGIGVSTVDAKGEVYGLEDVKQFPGDYAEGRYGFAFGTQSAGDLWLKNTSTGVILHLKAKREGLMLSLGASAVGISM